MPLKKDYLWLNIRELPYFRSLMRAVEGSFYEQIDLPEPVLDLGCGDAQFASVTFDKPIAVGLDPWLPPMREAAKRNAARPADNPIYQLLVQGDGQAMPFATGHFASAMSNSVLEHIPPIEAVLKETGRVLAPGAPFVFCGPNQRFLTSLSVGRFLDKIGMHSLANSYREFFDRISRHYNDDTPEVWTERLEKAGFEVVQHWTYYDPAALHVTEWGHYFGLPSLVAHWLTGRWIIAPTRWNLALTEALCRRYFDPTPCDDGVCAFFIARRR